MIGTPVFKVRIYSHFFKVSHFTPRGAQKTTMFAGEYVQMGWMRGKGGKSRRVPVKVYAARTHDKSEYRFHINVFDDFVKFMNNEGIPRELYTEEIVAIPKAAPFGIKMKSGFSAREHQIPVGVYLNEPPENNRSRFVDLQTGKGKGIVTMFALEHHDMRAVAYVRPKFMEKWALELAEKMRIDKKRIMTVRGSAELKGLIQLCKNGDYDYPVTIISNKTMQNWIKEYENHPYKSVQEYGCSPEEICKILGAGLRIIDEVHLDFHLNFKLDLYTHVAMAIALSATLMHDQNFMEDMYKIMFPPDTRYQGSVLDRYVSAFSFMYNLDEHSAKRIKTTEWGSNTYSHHAFEKSILRDARIKKKYFEMIAHVLRMSFIVDYEKGEKAAIFVASIAMATVLAAWLRERYPQFSVTRYVEDDPYSNLLESDIRVTTIQSGGTAHDIADLKSTLLTVAVNSIQANIQTLGRLRKREDGKPTRFHYFTCLDIKKHMEYHERKSKMLKNRAATFREIFYSDRL